MKKVLFWTKIEQALYSWWYFLLLVALIIISYIENEKDVKLGVFYKVKIGDGSSQKQTQCRKCID